MTSDDTRWYEIRNQPGFKPIPAWLRRFAIDANDIVFVAGGIAGSEMAVFLCAGYDGTEAIVAGKHAYYPAEWLKREFPNSAGIVAGIEQQAHLAKAAEAGDLL